MRLYQWSNEGMDKPTLWFVADMPDGGTKLECGYCHEEFIDPYPKGLDVCPHCQRDLVFPRCDW